jgi:predicted DsbA family dithiol-disulfide isomerase
MTSTEDYPVIEVFADIGCPYTHVGLKAVAEQLKARGREDVKLRVRSWPLEWVNGRPMDVQATCDHIEELREQVSSAYFTGFDKARLPKSTIPVLAFVAAAYRAGPEIGRAVSLELRDALFERGEDVSHPKVLAAIAEPHGLSGPEPDDYATVVADWKEGRARGVSGSPHFFCGDQSAFCPSLKISKAQGDEQRKIDVTLDRLQEFLDGCLSG